MARRNKTAQSKLNKQQQNKTAGEIPISLRIFLSFLPLLFIFVTYSHTLKSPFVFDDVDNITQNKAVHLTELSLKNLKKTATESGLMNKPVARPVSFLTFAMNYYFHGDEVTGYRFVNIFIHLMNGLLLYLFLFNTLKLPALENKIKNPFWIAYLAALIWFVNPLHVQSVTYIVQRMNSLATLFYLLAFFTYLKARLTKENSRKWLLATISVVSGIFALGSKEIAITLPLFILLYEWMFFRDMDIEWAKRNYSMLVGICAFLIGLLIGMVFIYAGKTPWQMIFAGYETRDFTLWERVLTQPRVILHYLGLILFPHPDRLTMLPQFAISSSLFKPPTTIIAILTTLILIGGAIYKAKGQRLIAFCILWYFGNLVLESSILPLEIIFQHRTYLPSMMIILLVVYVLFQYGKPKKIANIIILAAIPVLAFWTYERNAHWSDKITFWQETLEKNQTDFRIYNNLGKALEEKGEIHAAMDKYKTAMEIKPDHPKAYHNLGLALLNTGKKEEASSVLHKALEHDDDHPETHYNLGLVHGTANELKDAEEHYLKAHEHFDPDNDPDVHNNLGITLGRQGRLEEAVLQFKEAIRIDPDDLFAHNNLGITLARMGKHKEAITHFQHALRINPGDKFAWNNLQIVISDMKMDK